MNTLTEYQTGVVTEVLSHREHRYDRANDRLILSEPSARVTISLKERGGLVTIPIDPHHMPRCGSKVNITLAFTPP